MVSEMFIDDCPCLCMIRIAGRLIMTMYIKIKFCQEHRQQIMLSIMYVRFSHRQKVRGTLCISDKYF